MQAGFCSIRSLCQAVATALLAIGVASSGEAAENASAGELATSSYSFHIPAKALLAALADFTEVTGIQLLYSSDGRLSETSQALSGKYSVDQALQLMLSGTGLRYRFVNATTITLEKLSDGRSTRTLGPVRVEGADQGTPQRGEGAAQLGGVRGGQDQEARGLRPVTAAVGAGAPTAIEDIPRSVSVLTQAQMEAQDIQDFGEAIRRLPGLSMIERTSSTDSNAASGAGTISARGFNIQNVQVDGGAPRQLDIINNGLFNLSSFERLELVRGPNGVFAGPDSPGGSLNLVRKRPGGAPALNVAVTAGSFDRYQGLVDWSTPSLLDSPLAFRAVASYEDQKFKWDNDHLKRSSLYGLADLPLGERARLELGAQYQNVRQDGLYQSSYRYYDGPNLALPFYYNYTPAWSYLDAETYELFSRFYVRLLGDWNFDVGLSYANTDKRSLDSVINGGVYLLSNTDAAYQICSEGVCFPLQTSFFAREYSSDTENLGIDFRLTGKFRTWGLDHNVYIAGNFGERIGATTDRQLDDPAWPEILTLADFGSLSRFAPPAILDRNYASTDPSFKDSSSSYGLVVSDFVSWRELIFLTLSARLQDVEGSAGGVRRRRVDGVPFDVSIGEISNGDVDRARRWRPSWSLAAKPMRDMTIYGSYSEGATDQSRQYTREGKQLGPIIYENSELGLKYGVGDWLFALSSYRLKQNNVATFIPDSLGQCGPTPASYCYFASGTAIESKGYDVEMAGRLFGQLDLQLSYTDNETTQTSTQLPDNTRSPGRLAKLFANWDLPWYPALSVNVGAVYTGSIYENGTRTIYDPATFAVVDEFPFAFGEPSTLIWDVGVDYALNDHIDVTLFVENVADTEYYSTVSSYVNHIGNPRTAMLKVTWREGGDRTGLTRSPTTGLAPFGDPADWYGVLDFGRYDPEDWQARSSGAGPSGEPVRWTFETKPSAAFFARLGYRLTDHWRAEGEVGLRQHGFGSIGGNDTAPYGLCGLAYAGDFLGTPQDRLTNCYEPQGEAVYWTFLGNLIRDFGAADSRLRPFLGAGIGATRASVDFSGRFDGYTDTVFRDWYRNNHGSELPSYAAVAPGEKVLGSDASWGLSFQLLAGMSWQVTDRAIVDVTYKYLRDVLDIRTVNLTDYYPKEGMDVPYPPYFESEPNRLVGAGLPQLGSFKGDLNSHTFTLGLRWAFGSPH